MFLLNCSKDSNISGITRNEFNVTFETSGGTKIPSQIVNIKNTVTKPTDPIREDYNFEGWYGDKDFVNIFDFNTKITTDTTLFAFWKKLSFTIKFNTRGGNTINPITVEINTKITPPTVPTRNNLIFKGWFTDHPNYKIPFDFNTPISKNIVIYAKWE